MPIPTGKKRPVKLEDVAEAADVSIATVSLALRNHHSVTKDTRERILEVQKQLGYTPLRRRTPSAKSRKEKIDQRQTFLYCIVDFPVKKYEYTAFLEGAMEACQEKRIRLELASISSSDVLSGEISHAIPPETTGVILTGNLNQELVDRFRSQGLKLVALGNYDLSGINKIEVDIFRAGGMVARRAIERGHKEVAAVLGNPQNYFERHYLMGIRDTMEMEGLELPQSRVYYSDDRDLFGSMAKIVDKMITAKTSPTAVICHAVNVAEAFLAEYRGHAKSRSNNQLPAIFGVKSSSKELPNPYISMLSINLEQSGRLAISELCQIAKNREHPVYSAVLGSVEWDDEAR